MDADSLMILVKTKDIYEDNTSDVEKVFDTSNYKINRPSRKGKNKKSNWINER